MASFGLVLLAVSAVGRRSSKKKKNNINEDNGGNLWLALCTLHVKVLHQATKDNFVTESVQCTYGDGFPEGL